MTLCFSYLILYTTISHYIPLYTSSLFFFPPLFSLPLCFYFQFYHLFYLCRAYGAMETHQTSDLRIAGSIPATLVFFSSFFIILCLRMMLFSFFSIGNVAQSVERKSHNLKVVSSILTVPTFFAFCSFPFPRYSSLPLLLLITVWAYGAMETHQTSDLRIAGSIPAMLVFFTFFPSPPYSLFASSHLSLPIFRLGT